MGADIQPGAVFPDYELPDHTTKRRKVSELQEGDPMVLAVAASTWARVLPREL